MENQCMVSIIIPVYNAEKHLEKSINSVLNQTLDNIEVILVNDGSTDESLSICRKFEKQDNRVCVIDKVNGGVSSARNEGIKVASGEFIGFIDPDDWIDQEMYLSMYEKAKRNDVDVVLCNYINHRGDDITLSTISIQDEVVEKERLINEVVANMISGSTLDSNSSTIAGTIWRTLIKRDLITKNNIEFDEKIPLMEDLIFIIGVLLNIDRIVIDEGHFYHYVHYNNTAGRKYRNDYIEISQKVYDKMQDLLSDNYYKCNIKIRMDYRYVNMKLQSIANETRKENSKKNRLKYTKIRNICNDPRLGTILSQISYDNYTIRKKFVLNALYKKRALFLFVYFSMVNHFNSNK